MSASLDDQDAGGSTPAICEDDKATKNLHPGNIAVVNGIVFVVVRTPSDFMRSYLRDSRL